MEKKMLICGGIIALVMLTIPYSSAVNVNTNVDSESRENLEIETLDSSKEIISYISGDCNYVITRRWGVFRHVEIYAGDYYTGVNIVGIRRSLLDPTFSIGCLKYVNVPHFFGFHIGSPVAYVAGIALGNIEWS